MDQFESFIADRLAEIAAGRVDLSHPFDQRRMVEDIADAAQALLCPVDGC